MLGFSSPKEMVSHQTPPWACSRLVPLPIGLHWVGILAIFERLRGSPICEASSATIHGSPQRCAASITQCSRSRIHSINHACAKQCSRVAGSEKSEVSKKSITIVRSLGHPCFLQNGLPLLAVCLCHLYPCQHTPHKIWGQRLEKHKVKS